MKWCLPQSLMMYIYTQLAKQAKAYKLHSADAERNGEALSVSTSIYSLCVEHIFIHFQQISLQEFYSRSVKVFITQTFGFTSKSMLLWWTRFSPWWMMNNKMESQHNRRRNNQTNLYEQSGRPLCFWPKGNILFTYTRKLKLIWLCSNQDEPTLCVCFVFFPHWTVTTELSLRHLLL